MSTPHMSGRRSGGGDSDDHLDSSDLLDADGRVDISAIHSLTNAGAHRGDRLSAAEADEIRERVLGGESLASVASDLGRSEDAVRTHARGEVSYQRGESPTHRPVEYHDGTWRLAVVYVTRYGRVYHTDPSCADIMHEADSRDRSEAEADGLRECRHCAAAPGDGGAKQPSVMALRKADPDAVFPSSSDRERASASVSFIAWWLLVLVVCTVSVVVLYCGGAFA